MTSSGFINSDTNLDSAPLLDELRAFAEADKLRMPRRKSYPLASILDAFNESSAGHVVGKLVIEIPSVQVQEGSNVLWS